MGSLFLVGMIKPIDGVKVILIMHIIELYFILIHFLYVFREAIIFFLFLLLISKSIL